MCERSEKKVAVLNMVPLHRRNHLLDVNELIRAQQRGVSGVDTKSELFDQVPHSRFAKHSVFIAGLQRDDGFVGLALVPPHDLLGIGVKLLPTTR